MTEKTKSRTVDFNDAIAVAGLGLLTYGTWQILPAAAYIVAGVVLLLVAIRRA